MTDYVPYCGSPPVPGDLATAWNLDPWLAGGLAVATFGYAYGIARESNSTTRQVTAFTAGWLIVAVALISPLCNLTVALFSARVAQHMLLTLVAAPLIVLGCPERALARLLSDKVLRAGGISIFGHIAGSAVVGPVAFALLLWFWHLPGPYDATLRSDSAYWTMHLSLFVSALMLWWVLLREGKASALAAVAVGFLTSLQMSLLGAFLTFAPAAWYESHQTTTWPWGLSPLADQQLGGLIMWVPGCTVFLIAGLAGVALLLYRMDRDPTHSGA